MLAVSLIWTRIRKDARKVLYGNQRRNGHLADFRASVSAKMFLHLVCFSLEIKMKLKAKLFKKKKYTVTAVEESFGFKSEPDTSTFESFDDIDPWQCCSDRGQDISYSCVLETMMAPELVTRHQAPSHMTPELDSRHQSACHSSSSVGDSHYACSDITMPAVSSPCCYTYWSLPSHTSLLVES